MYVVFELYFSVIILLKLICATACMRSMSTNNSSGVLYFY